MSLASGALSPAAVAADEAHYCLRCAVAKITGAPGPVQAGSPPTFELALGRTTELLAGAWDASATPHIEAAVDELLGVADSFATEKAKAASARRIVGDLEATLEARAPLTDAQAGELARYLMATYRLGKTESARSLGWSVSMRLVDQDAVAGLTSNGVWWVGKTALNRTARALLQDAGLEALQQGLGRQEAAALFARAVGTLATRSQDYWEGFAAVYLTRSRSFGSLTAMIEMGGRTYRYVNPLDERTSDVCRELAGTEFTVRESVALRDRLLGSSDPDAWRAIAPWPSHADVLDASGQRLPADELQRRGIAMPPLHMHCRSAIDVEEFEADVPPAPLPPVEKPAPRAPRVRAPKAPAPPPARVDESAAARKAAYLASQEALRARGLSPTQMNWSPETRQLQGYGDADVSVPDARMRSRAAFIRADRTAPAGLAAAMSRDLELHDAHLTAAAQWFATASPAERHAARRELVSDMVSLQQQPRGRDRDALIDGLTESLRGWDPTLLVLLRRQGSRFRHKPGRAQCGSNFAGGALIEVDFGQMANPRVRHTVAHETAHGVDFAFSGDGGGPWNEDLLAAVGRPRSTWRDGFGAAYAELKARHKNTVRYIGDPTKTSEYAWDGPFVSAYEGRIYSGKVNPTGLQDVLDSSAAGPIEFIAMQQSYLAEGIDRVRTLGLMEGLRASANNTAAVVSYPRSYFEAYHRTFGGPGLEMLREGFATGGWALRESRRGQVASVVWAHTHLGVPLDEAIAAVGADVKGGPVDWDRVRAAVAEEPTSTLVGRLLRGTLDVGV